MLQIYNKLEDVPEALREHYELSGGKYIPKVSDDHPLVVKNRELLNETSTAKTKITGLETQVTKLQADVTSAQAGSVPRGQRLVSAADAEALEKFKAIGTVDEVTAKVTEHATLKASEEKRTREDNLRAVAKDLGYDNVDAFIRLPNLPDFETREVAGKKTVIAKIKDDKGVVTEKPATEFMESSPDLKPFLPALKTQSTAGVSVHGTASDSGQSADQYKWAKEFGENWNKQRPQTDVAAAFGIPKQA